VTCTNTSLPPSSGVMNPYPFDALKNFTVPFWRIVWPSTSVAGCPAASPRPGQAVCRESATRPAAVSAPGGPHLQFARSRQGRPRWRPFFTLVGPIVWPSREMMMQTPMECNGRGRRSGSAQRAVSGAAAPPADPRLHRHRRRRAWQNGSAARTTETIGAARTIAVCARLPLAHPVRGWSRDAWRHRPAIDAPKRWATDRRSLRASLARRRGGGSDHDAIARSATHASTTRHLVRARSVIALVGVQFSAHRFVLE